MNDLERHWTEKLQELMQKVESKRMTERQALIALERFGKQQNEHIFRKIDERTVANKGGD